MKNETTDNEVRAFDEVKAKSIIEKYGLSTVSLRVWKTRGKIPLRYLSGSFEKRVPLSEKEAITEKKLVEVLRNPALNLKALCKNEIDYTLLSNAVRKDKPTSLSKQNLKHTLKIVREFHSIIKKVIGPLADKIRFTDKEKQALDDLLNDERINKGQLLKTKKPAYNEKYADNNAYFRHIERTRKTITLFEDWEAVQISKALASFSEKLSL
jgi:hypothetical protein